MSVELSHGKARPTLPRSRALSPAANGARPEPQRDAQGRVIGSEAARELAQGRGWKALCAELAGRDRELKGEARQLGRASWRLYLALMRSMPSDGPQVRVLVAAQARSAILSARFAARATELGLDSSAGMGALEMSAKLDQRAERLAVTAMDIANALAKAVGKRKVIDVHARVAAAFPAPKPTALPKPPVSDRPGAGGQQ